MHLKMSSVEMAAIFLGLKVLKGDITNEVPLG